MIKRKIDLIPICLILSISLIDILVFLNVQNIYVLVLYFFLMIFPKGLVIAWSHNLAHSRPFKNNNYHLLFEFIAGFQTGILPNIWTLHHNIGHHRNFLDQDKDTSSWKIKGKVASITFYTVYNTLMTYPQAIKIANERGRKIFNTTMFFIFATIAVLVVLIEHDPVNAFFCYVLPMTVSLFLTINATHPHHSGLDTKNIFESCRNNLNPWYNLLTGNLGYHTAHHYKQGTHWSDIPALHETIKENIPEVLISNKTFYQYGNYN